MRYLIKQKAVSKSRNYVSNPDKNYNLGRFFCQNTVTIITARKLLLQLGIYYL
jgi:hypothetical protein